MKSTRRQAKYTEQDGIEIAQRSFEFGVAVIRLVRDHKDAMPGALADRLIEVGTGIGADVANAEFNNSRRNYRAKMNSARRASADIAYWLQLLVPSGITSAETIQPYLEEADALQMVLTAICIKAEQAVERDGKKK